MQSDSVDYLIKKGVDRMKIIIMIPTHGIVMNLTDKARTDLNAPIDGKCQINQRVSGCF